MGMAASQARYLSLVARKTNCEYEGQQINQARTALGNQSANLFNQMLGLQVPIPPSTQDFTKTQYSFSDGNNKFTIDSWKQVQSPNSDYNYIVDMHYNANVYKGSEKRLVDPQIQFAGTVPSTPTPQQIADIRDALREIETKQAAYDAALKDYNEELAKAKKLSTYADTSTYNNNIRSATYDPVSNTYTIQTANGITKTFTNITRISQNAGYLTDPSGNIVYRDPNNGEQYNSNSPNVGSATNYTPVNPNSIYQPDVNTYYTDLINSMEPRSQSTVNGNTYRFIEYGLNDHKAIDANGNISDKSIEDIISSLDPGATPDPVIRQVDINGTSYNIFNDPNTHKNYVQIDSKHYPYTEPFNINQVQSVQDAYDNLKNNFNNLNNATTVTDSNGHTYNLFNDGAANYIYDGSAYYNYPSSGFNLDNPSTWGAPVTPTSPVEGLIYNGNPVKIDSNGKYYGKDANGDCFEFYPQNGTFAGSNVLTNLTNNFIPANNHMVDQVGNTLYKGSDNQRYIKISGQNYLQSTYDYDPSAINTSLEDIIDPTNLTPETESVHGYRIYHSTKANDDYVGDNTTPPNYYLKSTYVGVGTGDISIQQERDDLKNTLAANPVSFAQGRTEIEQAINDLKQVGALDNSFDTNTNVFVDENGNIAFKSDLDNLKGLSGTQVSLSIYPQGVIDNEINTVLAGKLATLQSAELALNTAKMNYAQLSVPSRVGNCELTPLLDLTKDQEAEIKQIIKDMKEAGIDANIINCFENGQYVNASIYTFKMNGQTYYTTYNDLVNVANKGGLPNDIDIQAKLPYYNASYIEQKIEAESKALLETDSNGRFKSVRFENDSNTYTLNMETITDEAAYNDAMNKYYYENAKYDKMVQDINAKTSIIQQEDRTLELRLKQLDTEQNALKTEMEAVKKIVEDNVKDTFGTFKG